MALRPADVELSEEEKELARLQAEHAGDAQLGSSIGGVAGGALGALGFLIPGAGLVAGPALTALGSSVGGLAGGAIGGAVGGEKIDSAQTRLDELAKKREERLKSYALKQQALDALLGSR